LRRATVIVDLTLMPSCLVCGAYEALAVGTPLILSDDPAGRERFGPMALFSRDDPASIAAAIDNAIEHEPAMRAAALSYRSAYQTWWKDRARALVRDLAGR
jgi:glycosyltransferase involved in cell wall biosynthesis